MEVEVNFLAVLLATLTGMVIGAVWYAPFAFGKTWGKLVKIDLQKVDKTKANIALAKAGLMSLITAYVLAHVIYLSQSFFKTSHLQASLTTAFWLWLGISATQIVTHDAFEQRPKKLTFITLGNQLVSLIAMGLVIGLIN